MDRKNFIYSCAAACITGTTVLSVMMEGCAGSRHVTGNLEDNYLVVPVENFLINMKSAVSYRQHIIVSHSKLQYPIIVHRISESSYSAFLMKCTHQGNELSAFGDKLVCQAHGSEFDKNGKATSGPASEPLRMFEVVLESTVIKISLKKI